MKRIMAIVAAIVLLLTLSVNALAADGNVSYSGNAGEFVFEPGSEYSLTDLFPNFKDLMPGDTVTQRILLKNNADKRVNVRISMRALGAHHDSEAFLSQLQLKVTQLGKTDLFDAPANQTAQLSDWVLLGMLTTGGEEKAMLLFAALCIVAVVAARVVFPKEVHQEVHKEPEEQKHYDHKKDEDE